MPHPIPDAVRYASATLGHVLTWDPPLADPAAERWTCQSRTCGRAVLVFRDGTCAGSALDTACEPPED